VLGKIEDKVNPRSFNTWFKPTQLVAEDAASLTVRVPNGWFADWLRTQFLSVIQDALVEVERPGVSVHFTSEASEPPAGARRTDGAAASAAPVPGLNPRYTFDSFVVSKCNEFAHAAAIAVAEKPARSFNPLYIYGGVGLGKTHLMQAIGNRAAKRKIRMRYLTSERFMNELINAIHSQKTSEFRERYRNLDLLLVDDIQFMATRERTQEEFFHTFNALYEAEKHIVVASDVPPGELVTLEERLRSRVGWGLIADMQPPDLETKVAILKRKADAEGTVLPDDVGLFIASNSKFSIRELEGALIRVIAYASMSGREVSIDVAKETLRDFLAPEAPAVTIENIQRYTANYFNLKVSELKSANKSPRVALPRHIAMYLCKVLTTFSLPEIGSRFGGKHHSTVIHAIDKIEHKRRQDREFDRLIESFLQALK
jgi:chromosomal replication initiator protein